MRAEAMCFKSFRPRIVAGKSVREYPAMTFEQTVALTPDRQAGFASVPGAFTDKVLSLSLTIHWGAVAAAATGVVADRAHITPIGAGADLDG